MGTSRKIIVIAIAIIFLVAAGLAVYFQKAYKIIDLGTEKKMATTQPTAKPEIQVQTRPSKTTVKVGKSDTVSVNLPSASIEKPTAFDLTFSYDSTIVEVVNIVPGRLWTSSNVLKKDIDNMEGKARLAAGQGFNSANSTGLDIVEIEYKVLKEGQIIFELTNDSFFAYVGIDKLTPVTSQQVVIKAEN